MSAISPDQLLEQLNWRYATKTFDATKKISDDVWKALEAALILSPSSFGLQPWKFIVVNDPDIRATLRAASWKQSQTTDASHFVVLAVKTSIDEAYVEDFIKSLAASRGESVDSPSIAGYAKVISAFVSAPGFPVKDWATRQVYIALGNLMTSAALIGVDTCPMEGLDPAKYDEILGLADQGFATVVACAVGYRSESDKYASFPKTRWEAGKVIDHR
ncbi:MAG TPA: NAD(P)H-dependent oxidoreductase [Candidatus Methylacidiphilales bacterium]|nr:NAD(P)H-dependent oxidoreductase [Candidatus Methylacidiphilales bacterium]